MARAGNLPAAAIAGDVDTLLREHACLVVTAPPGAGKSTLLPITILEGLGKGRVLMLEPRRLAARQIAERMAWLLGEPAGCTAGYRVRFDSKVSSATRIEVLTEGIMTRSKMTLPWTESPPSSSTNSTNAASTATSRWLWRARRSVSSGRT